MYLEVSELQERVSCGGDTDATVVEWERRFLLQLGFFPVGVFWGFEGRERVILQLEPVFPFVSLPFEGVFL